MNFRRAMLVLLLVIVAGAHVHAEEAALRAFETIEMPGTASKAPERLQIQAFGRTFSLELAPNPSLLASLPAGQRARIGAGDLFLKGTLSDLPGSWVRLNRIGGKFSGGFFDGDDLYLVDRAKGLAPAGSRAAAEDAAIVFRLSDLQLPLHIDASGVAVPGAETGAATTGGYDDFVDHLREVAVLEGTAMYAMPVTIVSDVEFSARHGGNAASVVAGRINFIDGIYTNQLGVGITLWHHEILSANGNLTATDASNLFSQFRSFMTSGAGSEIPFEGLAHLFTDGRPQGGTAGIAFLGVLCNRSAGYGVNENLSNDTTSALVFAHEVGHNFNAPHDGQEGDGQLGACADETFEGIMNPSINGSQQFSDCRLEEMSVELNGAGCLVPVLESDQVFRNGFESTAR